MRRTLWLGSTVAAAAALTIAACGGGDGGSTPTSPTTPTTPTTGGTTITITSSGASPRNLTVSPGTRVTFVNNDTRPHEMNSDPHPTHGDCPEIDQVGFLAVGQSKQTGNLTTVRTCGFHDHNQPSEANLQGTIRVQ
jgi:plastocyanin